MFHLFLALCLTVVRASKDDIVTIHWRNENSTPSEWGGLSVQLLTPNKAYCGDGLFYSSDTDSLYYTDSEGSTTYCMKLDNGDFTDKLVDDFEGKKLVFNYPTKTKGIGIFGAEDLLIPYIFNSDTLEHTNKAPILVTNETGYCINKAHADNNGKLFLTLNAKSDRKHKYSMLYKLEDSIPIKVKDSKTALGDFVWSQDGKAMYLIADNGKCILKYKYDEDAGDISDEELVFKLPNKFHPEDCMTGIEIDNNDCLWVTLDCGVVLQVDTKTKEIYKMHQMPNKMLTGLTFGGENYDALLISTSKKCKKSYGSGGILYLSGINGTGAADVGVLL